MKATFPLLLCFGRAWTLSPEGEVDISITQLPNCSIANIIHNILATAMENTPGNICFSHLSVLAQTQVWFIWWTIYMYFNILTKTQLLLPQASLYKEVDVPEWYVWKPKHSFPGVFGWKKETRRANIKWAFIFERLSANGLLTLWSPGWSCFILKRGEHNRLGVPRGEWSNL